jgi:hypothetical protein
MILDLVYCFCVLTYLSKCENQRKYKRKKDLAGAAKTQRSLGAPDSVRCANGSKSSTVGCAKLGRLSAPDSEQGMSGGAPDCLVRHPTEGKNCLP